MSAPLAYRIRPRILEEFVGQVHILGKGKPLSRLIETDQIHSLVFFGPPGTGKTTLAELIAKKTKSNFVRLNAIEAKVSDVREVIEQAKQKRDLYGEKTILFVDEIHRFNKSQQDVLLKDIERGTISFIGATTANPLYSLNSALVSRSRLFEFNPLLTHEMMPVLERALRDAERGLGRYAVKASKEVLQQLLRKSDGDLRQVLSNLETAVFSAIPDKDGKITITEEIVTEVTRLKPVAFDSNEHYDLISAFIKSMRASKPDDAMHYLARMIKAGEDILFIARRMIIFASEDVGLADSAALNLALSTYKSCEVIGMPEARIMLGHCAMYLANAPKDRTSYEAINAALKRVEELPNAPVPEHLRNWSV